MVVPVTNLIESKTHIVDKKQSKKYEEGDLDSFMDGLESDLEFSQELSSARQWLANELPKSLSKLRLSKGLSQAQLAVSVGLRQPNISAIESGKRRPGYDTARRISETLGISTDDFYAIFDKS